jgi:hypothetical protein
MFHGRIQPSGSSHSRVPPLIELRCPNCSGILVCKHPAYLKGGSETASGYWGTTSQDKSFQASCSSCFFTRKDLSYFDLPKIGELYFQASVGRIHFWAWNHEHLEVLLSFLEGKPLLESRWWKNYWKFIPGAWKQPSHRKALINTANKLLQAYLTSGSNRSLRSLGPAKARPLTKR